MAWEEDSCICLNMQLIAILSRIGVSNGTSRALPIANITGSSSYNAVKVYTRGGWANNNATESWISHQEWKDDNKNYAFRLDVTTGQNAQNEQHHVYFVKQVW